VKAKTAKQSKFARAFESLFRRTHVKTVKFKCYQEDKLFNQDMQSLEAMYRQSRQEQIEQGGVDLSKVEQDEDVNTDEELVLNNKKMVLSELRASVDQFVAQGRKKTNDCEAKVLKARQELVRNYRNVVVLTGAGGEAWE